jgi:myo-inositol-1(or 4)-monophosphatase
VISAGRQTLAHLLRVCRNRLGAGTNRRELLLHRLMQNLLAINAAPPGATALHGDVFYSGCRAESLVKMIDVAHFGCTRIGATDSLRISHRRLELLPDRGGLLQQVDGVPKRLRHLRLAIEPHDASRRSEKRFRLREKSAIVEARIPLPRDLARKLQVLNLILTNRYQLGTIQQNVRRLQYRVIQQTRGNTFLSACLFLELSLPLQLAQWSERVEYPRQLGMFLHPRLYEQRAFRGIESSCQQRQSHVGGSCAQISRLVRHRDGVIVYDAEERLVFVLQINPVFDGSEVVSDVQRAGGLNAAEDAGHCAKLKSEREELQAISVTDVADSQLLDIAVEAARSGARVIRDATAQREKLVWETKGRSDFVSEVDKASEREIAGIIARRLPDAIVLGEELSPTVIAGKGVVVIADPLDGTTNFLHGYPEYSVSIAIARDGDLCAGVVLNAARDEEFTARRGNGAFLNGKRIHVSNLREPGRSLIGTGFPFKSLEKLPQYLEQFSLVMRGTAGIRRAGSAALDLSNVACGRFDAFWELVLAPWDVAAGVLMVREAGGVVSDLEGNPAQLTAGAFVAGNPAMHAWLLNTVRRANMGGKD